MSEAARTKAEKEAREKRAEDPEYFQSIGMYSVFNFSTWYFSDFNLSEDSLLDAEVQEINSPNPTCCMRRCMAAQDDFINEKPKIQLIIEAAGHKCVFLPKFHCELNPIEMYWGYAKRCTSIYFYHLAAPIIHANQTPGYREKCDGTLSTPRKLVPECLDSCDILTIRHFWRKSWRYMDAYSCVWYNFW